MIREKENRGFIEACNEGVKVAQGELLLFLNNDTVVTEQWLTALVETIERDPKIGAVGAKLIYPDGHLQGAGGIIMCRVTITIKYLPTITARANHPPVIFDTIELHYLREQRRAELEGDLGLARKAALIRARELYLAQASDMVWVVSTYEAELLRRENAALRIEVVPLIQTMRAAVPPFAARRDLMFIGGFRHPPNEDAVLYFVRQIFLGSNARSLKSGCSWWGPLSHLRCGSWPRRTSWSQAM